MRLFAPIITGSLSLTGSLNVTGSLGITGAANSLFLIKNIGGTTVFQVSHSGVAIFATQSAELTGTAPNGGLYFTSGNFFVGLD